MLGNDIATAEFKSGDDNDAKCEFKDRYTPFVPYPLLNDDGTPNGVFPAEDDCGANSGWVLVNCVRDTEKGVLVLEVRRGLDDGGDSQDREIIEGENIMQYAYGGNFGYHGGDRGSVAVVLYGKKEDGSMDKDDVSRVEDGDTPEDVDGEDLLVNVEYNVPGNSTTTYACTGVEASVEAGKTTTIVGAEPVIQSKNEKEVHHFLVYVCQNNDYWQRYKGRTMECLQDSPLGNPKSGCSTIVYGWAKGSGRFMFPKITGFEIDSSTKYLIIETHFDNPNLKNDVVDSSGVKLFYSSKGREQPGAMLTIGDGLISYFGQKVINLSQYNSTCPKECTSQLEKPINVFGSGLHMHRTGQKIWTNHYDKSGEFKATREAISFWSDAWQKFGPTKPWTIQPGDTLTTSCIYDTTNKPETKWGLETKDEMCMQFLFVYPVPKLKPDGRKLYFCGVFAPPGTNETATTCSAANVGTSKTGILPIQNPSFEDRQGLNDTFGDKPKTCRSAESTTDGEAKGPDSTTEGDDDAECFPSIATVQLESGDILTMDQVSIGDRVKVAAQKHSEVYFFSHRDPHASSKFVEITASSSSLVDQKYKLTATRDHLIVTERGLVPAKKIRTGDILYDEHNVRLNVISKRLLTSSGLFSPHTMEGNILVDGIQTSTCSNYLPATIAHALLLPERLAYRLGFSIYGGEYYVGGRSDNAGRPFIIESAYRLLRMIKLPGKTDKDL